jgi:hypothetical protein
MVSNSNEEAGKILGRYHELGSGEAEDAAVPSLSVSCSVVNISGNLNCVSRSQITFSPEICP